MRQRTNRSKCLVVENEDLDKFSFTHNKLTCPICHKECYNEVNRDNLRKFGQHIRWHFEDKKIPTFICKQIYDFYFGKTYCKICNSQTKFIGICAGYMSYCDKCANNYEFAKSKYLNKEKLPNQNWHFIKQKKEKKLQK